MNPPTTTPTQYEALYLLRSGYSNAQDVIRFLDTKVAIISAAVTLMLGYAACLAKWWIEKVAEISPSWHTWEKAMFFVHPILLLLVGSFGLVIIIKAANVWRPNHSPLTQENFTALFPEWDGNHVTLEFVDGYLRNLANNESQSHTSVAAEYAIQCRVLGKMLHNKISAAQKLSPWFTRLYCAIAAETIAVIFCVTWKIFCLA